MYRKIQIDSYIDAHTNVAVTGEIEVELDFKFHIFFQKKSRVSRDFCFISIILFFW